MHVNVCVVRLVTYDVSLKGKTGKCKTNRKFSRLQRLVRLIECKGRVGLLRRPYVAAQLQHLSLKQLEKHFVLHDRNINI